MGINHRTYFCYVSRLPCRFYMNKPWRQALLSSSSNFTKIKQDKLSVPTLPKPWKRKISSLRNAPWAFSISTKTSTFTVLHLHSNLTSKISKVPNLKSSKKINNAISNSLWLETTLYFFFYTQVICQDQKQKETGHRGPALRTKNQIRLSRRR